MAAKIIQGDFKSAPIIIDDGYINPYEKKSHAADPLTDVNAIADISDYFIKRGKLRNNLIFIIGCNCGLRCGEILSLTWGHLIESDGTIKRKVSFVEEKTSKRNKMTGEIIAPKTREVIINDAVQEAIELFMSSKDQIVLSDYVFKSESRSAKYISERRAAGHGAKHDHLTRQAVDLILKQTVKEAFGYIDMNISTHTLRKTFARHVLENVPENQRHDAVAFLQQMLGHARAESTLHYIGVTKEAKIKTFDDLNLGKRRSSPDVIILDKNIR